MSSFPFFIFAFAPNSSMSDHHLRRSSFRQPLSSSMLRPHLGPFPPRTSNFKCTGRDRVSSPEWPRIRASALAAPGTPLFRRAVAAAARSISTFASSADGPRPASSCGDGGDGAPSHPQTARSGPDYSLTFARGAQVRRMGSEFAGFCF